MMLFGTNVFWETFGSRKCGEVPCCFEDSCGKVEILSSRQKWMISDDHLKQRIC